MSQGRTGRAGALGVWSWLHPGAGSWLSRVLRPRASIGHAQASCRVAQCQPKASLAYMCTQRVPCGLPSSNVQCGQALGSRHRQGPGRGYPGRGTHAGSGVRQTRIRVSVVWSWVSPFTSPCLMGTLLCGHKEDNAQHIVGTLKKWRVPEVLSSPGEPVSRRGLAGHGPRQLPKSQSPRNPRSRRRRHYRAFAGSAD